MGKSGFVFILINDCMDDVAIIGFSNDPPRQVAMEISRHTGVPVSYRVLFSKKTRAPEMGFNKLIAEATKGSRAKLLKSNKNMKVIVSDIGRCEDIAKRVFRGNSFRLSTPYRVMGGAIILMVSFLLMWVSNP
ncbi:hypothetical protein ACTG16_23595 [Aeromonas sp. 23P]|uniref:hypothetical protein n=1 Tax=Aeromonas sp. 23P TaxID=3452716 RepID=UPI003F7A7D2A|nr:hypothetical protein [Aeromonas veronii]